MISHLGSRWDMGVPKAQGQERGQLLRVAGVVVDFRSYNINMLSFPNVGTCNILV